MEGDRLRRGEEEKGKIDGKVRKRRRESIEKKKRRV